jgi:hypothetical protein
MPTVASPDPDCPVSSVLRLAMLPKMMPRKPKQKHNPTMPTTSAATANPLVLGGGAYAGGPYT